MGKERIKNTAKRAMSSSHTYTALTAFTMGMLSLGTSPNSYEGRGIFEFNNTAPIDTQLFPSAHNAGTSVKKEEGGTPFAWANQQLTAEELLEAGAMGLELDLHYEGGRLVTMPPTVAPSAAPSETPTESPTQSASPTQSPTVTSPPSIPPSEAPSQEPTLSHEPTTSPAPSVAPSNMPSETPTISSAPSVSAAPSMAPSDSSQPSPAPTITSAPTVTPEDTKEGYVVRHGDKDSIVGEPKKYNDHLQDIDDFIKDKDSLLIIKMDDSGLESEAEKVEAISMSKDTFGEKVWSREEQLEYAADNGGKWPSKEELLDMGKKIIIQNEHYGATEYNVDWFPVYGDNEDRTLLSYLQRGLEDMPLPDCLKIPESVGKFSKKDVKDKAQEGGSVPLDFYTDGDPRLNDRKLFGPEMAVLSHVMRFSPETKEGNAAMFGFSMAYAQALGVLGASLLAKKDEKEEKKGKKTENSDDISQDGSLEQEQPKSKSMIVNAYDAATSFISTVSKAALPMAMVGQAALRAGALFPENRIPAVGMAGGAFALKAFSDRYRNRHKDADLANNELAEGAGADIEADNIKSVSRSNSERSQVEISIKSVPLGSPSDDVSALGESISKSEQSSQKSHRGKREKEIAKNETSDNDRIKGSLLLGVSALLDVTGSDKYDTPFPVSVAAAVTATMILADSLKNFNDFRKPDKSSDKQSLAFAKFAAKAATAAAVFAQNAPSDGAEGKAVVTAIAMTGLAAVSTALYGERKFEDMVGNKVTSWVEKHRQEDAEKQELLKGTQRGAII